MRSSFLVIQQWKDAWALGITRIISRAFPENKMATTESSIIERFPFWLLCSLWLDVEFWFVEHTAFREFLEMLEFLSDEQTFFSIFDLFPFHCSSGETTKDSFVSYLPMAMRQFKSEPLNGLLHSERKIHNNNGKEAFFYFFSQKLISS